MNSLKSLNHYLLRYKTRLILGTCFVTISNIFAIYPAEILRRGIDLVTAGISIQYIFRNTSTINFVESGLFKLLLIFGIIVIASALLKGLFMFFMRQTIIVMSRHIEFDLKNDIYQHYQKLDLGFYRKNKTGDLMARISEDVSQVRMYIGPAIMYAISTITLFVLILVRMLSINVELTLYVITPLPILAISIYFVNSYVIKRSERVQRQLSTISSYVQEAFSGIRVIKAYNRETESQERFENEARIYRENNMSLIKINALFFPLIVLLIGLSTLLTVYIGGKNVFTGEITAGTIAEFILYVNMLTWPVASIGWVTSIVQRAAASQTRINEFLNHIPAIQNNNDDLHEVTGEIQFNNVSFVYPESGIKALNDVTFHIPAGTSLAIVGRTGSGKSTIAALTSRMFDAVEGEIKIDGQNIRQININSLRSSIGYVPQEVFLFSISIFDNIAFGLRNSIPENLLHEQVIEAAKNAVIHDNISTFTEAYETKIGERGLTLSGGQKQRISIARALIRKPAILILDDCLSAVDTQTEEDILKNLKKVMKNRTSIIIGHRISSVKHCDNIIVLEQGSIVEQGSHHQLLEQNGIYASMYTKQLLEEQRDLI